MTHPFAVGIDLGGTNVKGALVQRSRGLVYEVVRPTGAENGPKHVLENIADMVRELASEAPNREIAGIGVGSPGTINWERTTVSCPPNFPGWEVVDVASALRERTAKQGLPVIVENDANAAGLGSAHYGAGQPHDSFIMITLGTGVGGAIIYNNHIFRGSTGGAAEIGHMTIDYEGPVARSGVAGAVEAYLGQQFLSRHAKYRLLNRPSKVHEMTGDDLKGLTPRILFDAAVEGDEAAREVLAWAGHKLGCVLGSAVNLLDIRKIVVGGGVSAAGDFILDGARAALQRYVMPGLQEGLEIIQETLGNEAGTLGAAHLVFQHLDDHAPPAP